MRRRRNKFGAVKTNGFDSRLESRTYDELLTATDGFNADLRAVIGVDVGDVITKQFPIKFACGAKHIVDFAIWSGDTGELVALVEAKGRSLPVWALKMRLLKHEMPSLYDIYTVRFGEGYRRAGERAKPKRTK